MQVEILRGQSHSIVVNLVDTITTVVGVLQVMALMLFRGIAQQGAHAEVSEGTTHSVASSEVMDSCAPSMMGQVELMCQRPGMELTSVSG